MSDEFLMKCERSPCDLGLSPPDGHTTQEPIGRTDHARPPRAQPTMLALATALATCRPVCMPRVLAPRMQKFGTKEYWDGMYSGSGVACTVDGLSAEQYSWYCGWAELEPFWRELVPETQARVLVPGVGNDNTVAGLYDAGWKCVTAFDYSADAVERAATLFDGREIELCCADARELPWDDASFDAVLDKGALDAIGIFGRDALSAATAELERAVVAGGVVVSISRALEPTTLTDAFAPERWEPLRDGGLHVCESGEVSLDLAAGLFAWRRRRDDAEARTDT